MPPICKGYGVAGCRPLTRRYLLGGYTLVKRGAGYHLASKLLISARQRPVFVYNNVAVFSLFNLCTVLPLLHIELESEELRVGMRQGRFASKSCLNVYLALTDRSTDRVTDAAQAFHSKPELRLRPKVIITFGRNRRKPKVKFFISAETESRPKENIY